MELRRDLQEVRMGFLEVLPRGVPADEYLGIPEETPDIAQLVVDGPILAGGVPPGHDLLPPDGWAGRELQRTPRRKIVHAEVLDEMFNAAGAVLIQHGVHRQPLDEVRLD